MIKPSEIQQKARNAEVRDQQIEKDYVLSWILKGIAQHNSLSKLIVFKGGTVLKKIYFEDYRFSEDLDFTLLDNNTTNELIFSLFRETFAYAKEEANIPLAIIDNNDLEEHQLLCYPLEEVLVEKMRSVLNPKLTHFHSLVYNMRKTKQNLSYLLQ